MKLETDTRVRAREYLDGKVDEQPAPYARQLIGWLLEDLSAAAGEIRALQRERGARVTTVYIDEASRRAAEDQLRRVREWRQNTLLSSGVAIPDWRALDAILGEP